MSRQTCMLSGSKYRKGFMIELCCENLRAQKPFMAKNWPHSQMWLVRPAQDPHLKCLLFPECGLPFHDAYMPG